MPEFRLIELATRSGVSARNIRAYRERGLLDPPRREGRSAIYDDHHLSQLRMINELLGRGFTSAHIAEFFAGVRRGQDLADILGLQQAILGVPHTRPSDPVRIDPGGDVALGLLARGLAEDVDGEVQVTPRLAELVDGADDPTDYVRVMLRVSDGIADALDDVAAAVVKALEDSVIARFGPNYVPRPEDVAELREVLTDYRALGSRVVADRLDTALARRLAHVESGDGSQAVLSGHREPGGS